MKQLINLIYHIPVISTSLAFFQLLSLSFLSFPPLSSYLISTFPPPPFSTPTFPSSTIILTILKDLAAYILTVEIQSALDIVILRSPVHLDIVEGGERGGKHALLIVSFCLYSASLLCFLSLCRSHFCFLSLSFSITLSPSVCLIVFVALSFSNFFSPYLPLSISVFLLFSHSVLLLYSQPHTCFFSSNVHYRQRHSGSFSNALFYDSHQCKGRRATQIRSCFQVTLHDIINLVFLFDGITSPR